MRKRWVRILLKTIIAFIVISFGFLLFERIRGQVGLASYKRELAAKGETLDVDKLLSPPTAAATIAAQEILRVASLIQEGKIIPKDFPPRMRLVDSGRAVIGFKEDYWLENKATNSWAEAALDLATNKESFAQLRLALANPEFDFRLDHSKGAEMMLLHLAPIKGLSQWLGASCQNSLREGDAQPALEDLVTALTLPRVPETDGVVISELVRIAISSINLTTTWEALEADVWNDAQLALLQAAWQRITLATNLVHSLRVERADAASYYFPQYRISNNVTANAMFPDWLHILTATDDDTPPPSWLREFLRKQIYCRIWRFAWLDQDEVFYLKGVQQLIEDRAAGAVQAARSVDEYWFGLGKAPRQNFYNNWRYGLSADSLATFSRAIFKCARAETERSLVLSAIALKRFALRHGKPAPSLSALVPEFLPAVPLDYMDGKDLKYTLNPDGSSVLYSVGEDGVDDGGSSVPLRTASKSQWFWTRKDCVWPAPATKQEVSVYRQAAAKQP